MANALFVFNHIREMNAMQIQTFTVGMLSTNCYVVNCEKTKEAIIIDPGLESAEEAEQVFCHVEQCKLKVRFIVNTHGHPDHIKGDGLLKKKYSVPICIHTYDACCLHSVDAATRPANILLEEGVLLKIGRITLKVMHTPGHTPGSISLLGENLVFTGDTLFAGSIGRTDFPGGSEKDMRCSLKKLASLPEQCAVYPGHGATTTIGEEKRFNPFLHWL
ncbi:MAG: MBL fold metallo-hydrolase [Candidatus Bathyarchaeota archaeon]|nr:MBL fold metallo-hydrolase [Candidatus Bathyarchaeota archaeon]